MNAIKVCRACGSERLSEFMDLGDQYLSDFRRDGTKTPKYPIAAVFCEQCKLVQLRHTTPQGEMYHDRYGFKSGVSDSIRRDLEDITNHAYQYVNDPWWWLDIASNDGTLLSFVPQDVFRVGIDPVTFLCKEAEQSANVIINEYFSREAIEANSWYDPLHKFDVITSVSCFYDMPDPQKFVDEVAAVLAPRGIWVVQQNYLLTTMELAAVDNFCHEHITYYTLRSMEPQLKKAGLEVVEAQTSMVNGGSIRTLIAHRGVFEVDDSVYEQRDKEAMYGVDDFETYVEFSEKVGGELDRLYRLANSAKQDGKRVMILAASTRGATIWQSAGLDDALIEAAVERNPAKVGAEFTAIGVPIISEEQFRADPPDYAIVGPWFFATEIIQREKDYVLNGGTLVIPLPKMTLIGKEYFQ